MVTCKIKKNKLKTPHKNIQENRNALHLDAIANSTDCRLTNAPLEQKKEKKKKEQVR
jgi:hypothetical protein